MKWKQITSITLIIALIVLFVPVRIYAAFSFSRSITVNVGQVPSTQTSFPMLVSGTYTYLKTVGNGGKVQNANGYDVGFYSNANCSSGKLNWETETYDGTTGTVNYWINVASMQDGAVIYMCYGDASISTDQSNPTGVWDSSYKWVQHLPDGTTLSANDSTSGATNGTINGATATAGQIDGAAAFNGSSQEIHTGTQPPWRTNTVGTIEGWFNTTNTGNVQSITGYGDTAGSASTGALLYLQVRDNHLGVTFNSTSLFTVYVGEGDTTLSNNTWYHGVLTSNGSAYIMYVNGVAQTISNIVGSNQGKWFNNTGGDTTDRQYIGALLYQNTVQAYFGGSIDEVRISNIVRSANWITTEYNNQSAPSSFYTIGNETPIGGGGTITSLDTIIAYANHTMVFRSGHTFIFR